MNLGGLKIVITGASQGLGRAMALDLAQRGARMALLDLRDETLAATAAGCRALVQMPLGRPGTPAEVALCVTQILENDFLNGRVIEPDGGIRI